MQLSSDLSITDLDVPFSIIFTFCSTVTTFSNIGVLAVVTWQVLFVVIPFVFLTFRLQVSIIWHPFIINLLILFQMRAMFIICVLVLVFCVSWTHRGTTLPPRKS